MSPQKPWIEYLGLECIQVFMHQKIEYLRFLLSEYIVVWIDNSLLGTWSYWSVIDILNLVTCTGRTVLVLVPASSNVSRKMMLSTCTKLVVPLKSCEGDRSSQIAYNLCKSIYWRQEEMGPMHHPRHDVCRIVSIYLNLTQDLEAFVTPSFPIGLHVLITMIPFFIIWNQHVRFDAYNWRKDELDTTKWRSRMSNLV